MRMWHPKAITCDKGTFFLETARTSYVFRALESGQLEHLWWGGRIARGDAAAAALRRSCPYGGSVMYRPGEDLCLDALPQEWSGEGRGDYRSPPLEAELPDGTYTTDFRYVSHEVTEGNVPMACGLPQTCGGAETLAVLLRDGPSGAELTLYYTVYPQEDVIVRRAALKNAGQGTLTVRKLMSACVDLAEEDLVMTTFGGGWSSEFRRTDREVSGGRLMNESRTGSSSNRANPGFLLSRKGTGETHGRAWGFNLVYSGNHQSSAERAADGLVRVQCGMSPERFSWPLAAGETLETPEAVLSYSGEGFGALSRNLHRFVNARVVRGPWAGRERPVLVNTWEGFGFSFTREKLLSMVRRGARLGAELFVLDDGWFGRRDNDRAGLGDYWVNPKKLPGGLERLAGDVRDEGLSFGLWFEPEAVNEDSDLYRAHPDWAVTDPGREPVRGRSELLLDLTRPEVRDYLVESVGGTVDRCGASYVKWDMNRHLAGRDGAFAHRYILGLYDVLRRVFGPRPDVLLESCSSGGNRFDLGMLCFSPQIWLSDDTDPIERLDIQKGASYLYPPSAWGAHVSAAPCAQTLRVTPLATRFNAACFGCLGYELDLSELSPAEEREVRGQIAFYKANRRLFQYGDFFRFDGGDASREAFCSVSADGREAVTGLFRRLVHAAPGFEKLPCAGLAPDGRYRVEARPQKLRFSAFGRLLSYALPVKVRADGLLLREADRLSGLPDCAETFEASGAALLEGIPLANVYNGAGYNEHIRLPGDFGSNLYCIRRIGKAK